MADLYTQEGQVERMQRVLPPIASPSILGFYALAITTFVLAVALASSYAGRADYVLASAAMFGGLALLLSAMWSYRTMDVLGTALHGIWGSFFMGLGALHFFVARGDNYVSSAQFVSLGFWFVPLAIITFSLSVAATRVSLAIFATVFLLALGASVAAVGAFSGSSAAYIVAGWVLIFASLAAWWTATGMLLEAVMGHSPLPLFRREAAPAASATQEPVIIREK